MSSLMTMQAAVASVNCLLKVKPSAVKKAIDLSRLFTGRLTKILVVMGHSLMGRYSKDDGGGADPTFLPEKSIRLFKQIRASPDSPPFSAGPPIKPGVTRG